ncbi:creatininase family protein [Algihabitans albus]|uniref:creatininase family protein n=1 Tax=Algihabitans albus TaxID=2164067 RepID=UPI000E5C5D63|nr:creatininase family protein [Algihabitans albus]
MKLQLSTWPEVEAYLKTSTAILIPIGSTEQHGPTGFVGTDALCPEILAGGIAEQTGALVAPTVSVGMAQHHLGFAGSMTLRPSTLIAVLQDWINSLARHGFDRFYFLNGHGGNIATVSAAFSEVYAQASLGAAPTNRPALTCRLRNWWDHRDVQALAKQLFGGSDGQHATASEISLTYYGYPEEAQRAERGAAEMSPRVAPSGGFTDAADYRRKFPDGRMGSDPTLASVEKGRKLYETAVRTLSEDWRSFAASG